MSTAPAGERTLDCPVCGQTVIDTSPSSFGEHMTSEEFVANVARLIDAHKDTCQPRGRK